MGFVHSRVLIRVSLTVVLLSGSASAQPQSREQQRCITALNGGFAKVAKARSKAVIRCTKAAQKGDAFDACLAEQQQKLDKALAKLASTESKKCSAAPDFGPADLGALGGAGIDLATSAATDLFGAAPGNAIADKKTAKDTARCQLGVAKTAQKCALARVQAFNRCKKAGLKSGSIASADDLAACLDDDAGGRLAKSCTAKLEKAAARCAGVDLPTAFPACGSTGLADCADGRLACRARDALSAADGMDVPGCGAITPEADTARAATESIGTEGGEVMAVGGDGTIYRLSVPSGALLFETAITITPVSAIPDLPLTGGLLAAVEFAPDGLQLWQPATLTIELLSAPDPADLAGFGWTGAGDGVHLALPSRDGNTLTLGVTHFSGVGAAIVAPENLSALQALPPGSVEQQYFNQMPATDELDPAVWVAWLAGWFDAGVKPLLEGALASDGALLTGLDAFVAWKSAAEGGTPAFLNIDPNFLLGLDGFALANRIDEGLALAAPALREGVIRNDVECIVEEDLAFAEAELRWQGIAAALGLATAANGLDLGTILEDFCVEVVYEDITYPQFPQAGVPGTLVVSAGYAIDAQATQFDQALESTIDPTGTVETANFLIIPAGDVGEIVYTPTGDEELALNLNTCLYTPDDYPLLNGKVCQTAILVRGFEVTPGQATLAPGAEFDFDALLYGESHPSVTWTATGGEITQAGVYTAGDLAGTFTVTATSNFSGITQSATVTIGTGVGLSRIILQERLCEVDVIAVATAGGPNPPRDRQEFMEGVDDEVLAPYSASLVASANAADAFVVATADASASVEAVPEVDPGTGDFVGLSATASADGSANLNVIEDHIRGLAVSGGGGDAVCTYTFEVQGSAEFSFSGSATGTGSGQSPSSAQIYTPGGVALGRALSTGPTSDSASGVLESGVYAVRVVARGDGGAQEGIELVGAGSGDASLTLTLVPLPGTPDDD